MGSTGARSNGTSKRRQGREFRALCWLARHPGMTATPPAVATSVLEVGAVTTGVTLGSGAAVLGCWYRAHPDTFDYFAAPVLRAWRRRWLTYVAGRWSNTMADCGFSREHRKTGATQIPRLVKVRSYSPTTDTVWFRPLRGQSIEDYEAKTSALRDAFRVERVGVERVKPGTLALIIQRGEAFTEVIPAPDMPSAVDAVDITSVYVGDDEFDGEIRFAILGQHIFCAGASRSGKNSLGWSILRCLAPLIRAGLVRLWVCDPKQMEFAKLEPVAHRYAADQGECLDLVETYVAEMQAKQAAIRDQGDRKATISPEMPLDLLILDELGALTAFGDFARDFRRLLALIGSQGLGSNNVMIGFVQDPSKDTVPVRDYFTTRICLRVTTSAQVDMVLGEDARLRGALADEIPNDPSTAGIGYVIRPRTRAPLRMRLAYVNDAEVDDLITFLSTPVRAASGLRVVA
jgi:DNA segregation ATPase FtsK/SpoIIIE, S-DNA-T family